MRLIDADALIENNGDDVTNWDRPFAVMIISIQEAPTIDPVKHGKWEYPLGMAWNYVCSECGANGGVEGTPYCPKCGARMDGEA